MSDPVRLLQSVTRDGAVARSLREGAAVPELSDGQCDELWSALARRLPEAAVVATAGGAAMKAATVKAGAAKVAAAKATGIGMFVKAAVAVGVVGSVAVAAVAVSRSWSPSSTSSPAPRASAAEVRPVAVVTALPLAAPEAPVPQQASPTSPASPTKATTTPSAPSVTARRAPAPVARARSAHDAPRRESVSSLQEESAMILRARQALRDGDCVAALRELQASQTRFPEGSLAQEREVLSIEALACAGQAAQAEERADAFARDYPTSPHAATKAGASGGRRGGR